MACPVRRGDTCVCILSAKNIQFTVISLYINVKSCDRQKGKADHVSQPSFSQFSLDVISTNPHKPSQCASSRESSHSAELSVRDRGESACFLHFLL